MKKIYTILFSVFFAMSPFILSAQWSDNTSLNAPINVQSGDQNQPKIATHTGGVTYVSWFSQESGNYIVRLQKLDMFGNKQWGTNGKIVSNHQSDTWLTDYDLTVDDDTCAIVVFQDIRTGSSDAYAYKISPSGAFLWGANGIQLTNTADADYAPQVALATNGDVVVCWTAATSANTVGLQRISPNGTLLWGAAGKYLSGMGTHFKFPQVKAGLDGNVYVVWFKQATGSMYNPKNIAAQLFNVTGDKLWTNDLSITTTGGFPIVPFISVNPDSSGGAVLAWMDDRDNNNLYSSFVQHLNANGSTAFPANGVEALTTSGRHHADPATVFMKSTGETFAFIREEDANQNQNGLYAQKFSPTGERLWTNGGKMYQNISNLQLSFIQPHCEDSLILVFYLRGFQSGVGEKVQSMLIDKNGNTLWTPIYRDLSTVQSSKIHLKTSDFNSGQWLALWGDSRNDIGDIYGQNMKPDGNIGPVAIPFTISVDSLVFDTYEQCQAGLPFTITNPDISGISITALDSEGTYPFNEGHWFVDPVVTLPFAMAPGESKTIHVKMDSFVAGDIWNYISDTMYIRGTSGSRMVKILLNEAMFVGVKYEEVQKKMKIYPNPASDFVHIDITLPEAETVRLEFINAKGVSVMQFEKVLTSGNNKFSLQLKDLPVGYYNCILQGQSSGIFEKATIIKK